MKTNSTFLKTVSFSLTILVILQSCAVYQHKTASLDKALDVKRRIKIETNSNQTLKLVDLFIEEGEIYGVIKEKYTDWDYSDHFLSIDTESEFFTIHIPREDIKSIHLRNWPISILVTVMLSPLIIPVGLFMAIIGIEGGEIN